MTVREGSPYERRRRRGSEMQGPWQGSRQWTTRSLEPSVFEVAPPEVVVEDTSHVFLINYMLMLLYQVNTTRRFYNGSNFGLHVSKF
jgi:hypothetical protein